MIRKLETADLEQVMGIWLHGNVDGHPFIAKEYWESYYEVVKEQLVQSEIYVLETEREVRGFVGIADGYIAGIFVDGRYRSMGIGKQLLTFVKEKYEKLSLSVYQENRRAVEFYKREGFRVSGEGVDEETGSTEYTMVWEKMFCGYKPQNLFEDDYGKTSR